LLKHLSCNNTYYTQRFLTDVAVKTKNQTVIEFVDAVIDRVSDSVSALADERIRSLVLDTRRPFIDRNEIVGLGLRPLSESDMNALAGVVEHGPNGTFHFKDIKASVLK